MQLSPFQPMIIGDPLTVGTSAATVTMPYDSKVLCTYLLTVRGGQDVFFRFGATPTVTASNGIVIPAGGQSTFTGPPNAVIQAIAGLVGSTLYVVAGEGI
jgi:hypothetical protein